MHRAEGNSAYNTRGVYAVVATTIRLRFDYNTTPLYDHSTTYVTSGGLHVCLWAAALPHCDLNTHK